MAATRAGLALLLIFIACVCAYTPTNIIVINVVGIRNDTVLAATAAAGFVNRNTSSVYMIYGPYDTDWLNRLLPTVSQSQLDADKFIANTLSTYPAIIYDDMALEMLPAVITLCGVHDAVPLSQRQYAQFSQSQHVTVAFNSTGYWKSAAQATAYAAQPSTLSHTSSLAIQNPVLLAEGKLIDFIIARRLFTQYLTEGCVPLTADHELLRNIVDASPWSRPIRVYGYNSLDVLFGGDLFEAETDCVNSMGQVATADSTNLAFWQHVQAFTEGETLHQPASPAVTYDSKKRYVALVYGDMDNVDFVQTFGSDHMIYRTQRCMASAADCFPLTWTLSPNLIDFSPAMMRWYYTMSAKTNGRDWFIMPPSGTLYAYPGMMDKQVQQDFQQQQTAQAIIMNTTGSIHWEWFFAWAHAWDEYFPLYYKYQGATTRGFFLNDVPWVIPIPDMYLEHETYRFIGHASEAQAVVAFKPAFNWQQDGPGGGNPGNATQIAAMVNAFEKGSVQYIYVIQNTPAPSVFDMVKLLDEDIVLVGYEQLISLARQRELHRA
eukprot:TRINITY_DN601_c0_g1_i1.p1 TRINITY_DN601_c0_g1~~TRINITY_DN601_c0_g1_i1.p1  ORF type:complete len:554 (-),score=125.16 TRINITY_DN601_c0_g1_i1:145-1785(-)